ncbi:lipase family protein [Roseivirga pacifica]|uniref:lipase family protein n=1 Tax=Roseivirga pacifica TaxID=1267423 RepID=UPI003BA8B170
MKDQNTPSKKEQMIWVLSDLSNLCAGIFDQNGGKLLINKASELSGIIPGTVDGSAPIAEFLKVDGKAASVVWGPAMNTSEESYTKDGTTYTGTVVNNLMYVTECLDPETKQPMYVIAVSGTNPVSVFGWFDEDFDVSSTQAWPPAFIDSGKAPNNSNLIAQGSYDGLEILWGLKDPKTQKSLFDFIGDKLNGTSTLEIATCGHSLGGALAPLVATALAEKRTADNKNAVTLSTYPSADPTSGNDGFAGHVIDMLGAENYLSRINTFDVVPHGWAQQDMNEVAALYANEKVWTYKLGDLGIKATPLNEGLVRWAVGQKQPGVDFTRMAGDISFSGTIDQFNWSYNWGIAVLILGNDEAKSALQSIVCNMTGQSPDDEDLRNYLTQLLGFAKQAGVQHTSVYPIDCYKLDLELRNALNIFVNVTSSSSEAKGEEEHIVGLLISKVVTYLKEHPLNKCSEQ